MTPSRPRIPINDGGCILFGGCPGLTPLLLPEADDEDGIPIRGAGAIGRAPFGGCCPDIGGSRLAPNDLVPGGGAGAPLDGDTAMSLDRTAGDVPPREEVVAGPGEGAASSALVILS